jgi:hypothetical protein
VVESYLEKKCFGFTRENKLQREQSNRISVHTWPGRCPSKNRSINIFDEVFVFKVVLEKV